jgi:YD repeat-containing protein
MKPQVLVAMLLAVPMMAMAGVNLKNGDFYISYSDIVLTRDGHELAIKRTYNSKSSEKGWFGVGWGSAYETRLIMLPDGSAVVKEGGNGLTTNYRTQNESAIKTGVQRIVDAASKRESLTKSAAEKLAAQLLGDEELRLEKAIKYGMFTELPRGAALDDFCGKASLTRLAEGYLRKDCNRFGDKEPVTDTFDLQGHLIRRESSDGYSVTVSYADNHPISIKDTLGQRVNLTWSSTDFVVESSSQGAKTKYTQDEHDNLIKSEDEGGLSFRYSYDNSHNMTRIDYVDDSSMFISYSPRLSGVANAVTERNGDQQTYSYRSDPGIANHTWTKVTLIADGAQVESKEYEFENHVSPTGSRHLAKIAQTGDGATSKQLFFDDKGRVIRKVNDDGSVSEYIYQPESDKLILVLNKDQKTEFHYDGQGNLVKLENSDGEVIALTYGYSQQIKQMVEVNRVKKYRRELSLRYNAAGKPEKIVMAGIGALDVEYDDKGEISKVSSKGGETITHQVLLVFQSISELLSVTGTKF